MFHFVMDFNISMHNLDFQLIHIYYHLVDEDVHQGKKLSDDKCHPSRDGRNGDYETNC